MRKKKGRNEEGEERKKRKGRREEGDGEREKKPGG